MSIRPTGDGAVPVVEAKIEPAPESPDELVSESDAEALAEAELHQFADAFSRVKSKPLAVNVILLKGLERTKNYIVARELDRLPAARNLDELKDALLEAWNALMKLQIFDAVDCTIDEGAILPDGTHTCTVVVHCVEKSSLNLHVGTYVQGAEGQGEASIGFTNVLGVAESATFSGQLGTASSNEFSLALGKPRLYGWPVQTELLLLQQYNNFQKWSSFSELLRGGVLSLQSEDQRHVLAYELAWRSLSDASHRCSPSVRAQLGGSLKSALRYTFRHDTFDDLFFPLRGYAIRSTWELGGFWPGANVPRYWRHHSWGRLMLPLGESAAVALTAEAGLLLPLAARPSSRPTCIADRFFLGGVSNGLQGFHFKGAGPMDRRRTDSGLDAQQSGRRYDALGGDVFASVTAALRFQVPMTSLQNLGIYGQIFANGGSSVLVGGTGKDAQSIARDFGSKFRWTVGIGLVWPIAIGQLELNFCRVLSAQAHDHYRHGFHIGFGTAGF